MEYQPLPLSCECGRVPPSISGVGFSSSHDLVIRWRCPRCHNNVYVVKPLLDCWLECSTEALAVSSNSSLATDTPDDRRFLHSIGVSYGDDGPTVS